MGGLLVHPVPVLSVVGCIDVVWLVACLVVSDKANLQNTLSLGGAVARSRDIAVTHQYGLGLLDLYVETSWPFLRDNNRDNDGCGTSVGLP